MKVTKAKVFAGMTAAWLTGILYHTWNFTTVGFVNGSCVEYVFYVSPTAQTVAGVSAILIEYLIPVIIMVICYSHIFYVIRTKVSCAVHLPAISPKTSY